MMSSLPSPKPVFPDVPLNVGIIGAGGIARTAHLPAYAKWGVPVVGITSRTVSSARALADNFGIPTIYASISELLADANVDVVDIATGPDGRLDLVEAAIGAGKHVLMQKPLIANVEEIPRLQAALAQATERGIRVAVNQNARWAPAWRVATLLIRQGVIGDVVGVTHLHDKPLPPLAGTAFDDMPHMLLADYLVHWIDITRCWLEGGNVQSVFALDGRVPGQPSAARNPWNANILLRTERGSTGSLRVVGDAVTESGGCPFWIHGTRGTIRGSVLRGSDAIELDVEGETTDIPLDGEWFPDGFAGAMGELMCAITDDREPENSATHVLASARIGFAAVASAAGDGAPICPTDLSLTSSKEESE